ncbi:velvet factor [Gautieria morchelliformis]|nr:velvet factor [Gautieria morchelliformis]
MIVRREDNSILDVDDINVDFFIVTVDLWSADGKHEMNLVLHPSSADRYVPPHASKPRKRGPSNPGPPAVTPSRPPRPTPYPGPHDRARLPTNHPPGSNSTITLRPIEASVRVSDASSPWSYPPPLDRTPFQAPTLPSIHSIGRTSPWNDVAAGLFDSHNVDPVLRDTGGGSRWPNELMLPSLPGEQQSSQRTVPHLPRHTYTRTLVGPLSANAQRLQDEHRKPGIFFLFQDLSIRTEGTFRLRMRLMNVGVPPAPNGLSNSVHTGVSPVLAQVFTEPFTVYSAKRFPGVPDTTALSIAFGNQGQKLPLRNRHGTGKQQRRPLRAGTASSDESS